MIEPKFVDRVWETEALRDWCSAQRATPLYIYGPEGCGKTRLLREFVIKFSEYFNDSAIAIYVNAMERCSIDNAILTSRTIGLPREDIEGIFNKFPYSNVGRVLADTIGLLLEKIAVKKKIVGNYVLVIVDNFVRAVGLEQVEMYVKWICELMWKLREKYRPRAVNFIVTTSESESLRLVARHRYAQPVMIWNLDKDSFEELFHILNPPSSIKFEDVWHMLGGNPGKLIELAMNYSWNISTMFRTYMHKLENVLRQIVRERLLNELLLVLEDPDNIAYVLSREMERLEEILTRHNLIMSVGLLLGFREVDPCPDIGLGKHYAWQIPLYREVLYRLTQGKYTTRK